MADLDTLPPVVRRCVEAWWLHIATHQEAQRCRFDAENAVVAVYDAGFDMADLAALLGHPGTHTVYRILRRHGRQR